VDAIALPLTSLVPRLPFNTNADTPTQLVSGIKRSDLIDGLRLCLQATPLFAPFALDLFLDKLTSTSDDVKVGIDCNGSASSI
jgi:hypothetical protein